MQSPNFPVKEHTISGQKPASWAYSEGFIREDDALLQAREWAQELGCTPVSAGTGAALRFIAAAAKAKAVVEVGTGTGVSALWLLRGMPLDGVLTTIDLDPEHQRAARKSFLAQGFPSNRTRVITGRALDVLPRLSDAAYDLVFCDGSKEETGEYVTQALRLLKSGGILAVHNALWHDRVADPAQRDTTTTGIRELHKRLLLTEGLTTALLPTGDGLLAAVIS